nr:site-specific DNA-methyltransferase [Gammaproteobacteria bacterium AqS3]
MATANWKNRTLFHGDNLDILRGMNSESVDLIATDPPFNKGRDFHATPDSLTAGSKFQDRWSWDHDVHQDWVDSIIDDHPKLWGAIEAARYTHSDSMGAFLCFLSVRVLAMHRILKPTGSLYLHCDTTANAYIRLMLDAIFGERNFRNEIVWSYSKWSNSSNSYQKN